MGELNNIKKPTISVLMSVHNDERYLAKAIQSILDQTYTDFEFIIMNDGSTDNSLQILEDYRSKDSRIRLIHQENAGIALALNNAFALSRGNILHEWTETTFPCQIDWKNNYNFWKKISMFTYSDASTLKLMNTM